MKDRLLDYYGKQVNQLFTSITIMLTRVLTVSLASWSDRVMVGGNLFPFKSLFSLIFDSYYLISEKQSNDQPVHLHS